MTTRRWPIALAALLLLAPASLSAQSYAQQVWDQLQSHYRTIAKNSSDWYLRNYVMGKLQNRRLDSWTFAFDKGTDYIITGACDNDCQDVDIQLKDSDDHVVERDDKADDTPVISFKPKQSGRYTIEITMTQCKDDPCYFGFGIFTK